MRLCGVPDKGPCGYYRIRMPLGRIAQVDAADVRCGPSLAAEPGEIAIVQRAGPVADQRDNWRALLDRGPVVWETDDDLWNIDPTNERAHRQHTAAVLAAFEVAARDADMVTVSTEHLADRMREFSDNVVTIPNHVDPALFDMQRPRNTRVTIGWTGSASHFVDWRLVAGRIRRFMDRNPAVDFHAIGQDPAAWGFDLRHRQSFWTRDIPSYYASIDFDIGIAPLADTVFNRSKSHIKALEYAALGIPVIASDVAPYRDFVIDGVTGFLVRREHEWEARLFELVRDEQRREAMGAAAKEHARAWSMEHGWQRWIDAYEGLVA